ncbi:unnamed protein product [Rotaria sordida]|uniref:DZF domain-containing protein n=1 Tax=Rotaria sordida TaxID=392033 RepID=A0A813W126_9BILA|nr:unnamed protein product [Rotaria sordida]
MSTNGMNYSMYNTVGYSQMTQQQQSFYGQTFQNALSQQTIPPYGTYQMYSSSISNQPQYNSYDHIIRSTAETLAAFNQSTETSMFNNPQGQFNRSNTQQSSNRRPMKNSFNTNNSTRMYYCETCRIACGGHATYQAHLNGSKHKKKELIAQNQQTPVNISTKTGVNILRCELCDITCTSSDAYKAHLDGSKHEKAMKLHRKLGKTIPSTEPQILNNVSTSSQIDVNSQTTITESQTLKNDEQKISLSHLFENNIKPIGEEYIETTYDNANKPILYHCKLCECKFNDIKGKDMHLKGKRHRLAYKKKVNPNFVVDNNTNNKLTSSKQKQINNHQSSDNHSNVEYINTQQKMNSNNQIDIDDDTRCLMMLHQQIIPTPNLLNIIEQFVNAVESALKSCSERLQTFNTLSTDDNSSTSETNANQSPLMGVFRIGLFGKSLIIKTDRLFHIVVICAEWPTKTLFQTIAAILSDNLDDTWKNKIQIQCQIDKETIELQTNTEEGIMCISIAFTSFSIQQQDKSENKSDEVLSKINCLNALNSIHSTRWFQNQVSIRQHASALVRCLRYKTKVSTNWKSLSSEAIEILIDYTLSQSLSAVNAFRRVLEYLSGGLVLSNGPGLRMPWHTDLMKDVLENLTNQERNDITQEAQIGLRLMSFGQLTKWLEQSNIHQLMVSLSKRSLPDCDDQIRVKRQCTELE